ncbi:MAG TPA: SDR family oxidoreductase [Candidatus Acidoferrales bacterium]|nr:SDR family oxidoreductase [Candidatus Acidoferrales bacterium]
MILITGASGSVGKVVLQEACRKESNVRAMYRSKEEAAKAPPACEAVLADYSDKQSLRKALVGVTSVYVVCSPIPQLVELESNMLDACKESGVKHVVLNSALGAGDYPKSFPGWHRKVEDKLKATGMSCTILRPNGFLQNIVTYNAPSIRAQGAFYAAMGDAKVSYLDVGDIAVVAVKALQAGAHAGKTYELNGPEAISNQELAKRISKAARRTVNYVDIPESAQREAMLGLGMPEWQVTALLELQHYYKQGGGAKTDGLLKTLIERAPVTLDQYLTANAREFRDHAASA